MGIIDRVLSFWFGVEPRYRPEWFMVDPAFDEAIRDAFLADYEQAAAGGHDGLGATALGSLTLCILLDQFPRNLFRGTPRAYATDPQALRIAKAAIARGQDQSLTRLQRIFIYLPLEHSEDLADQEQCVTLCAALDDANTLDSAVRHRDIIARFGHFPHRNAILGRESSPEEIEFLRQPGSSF